MGIDIADTQAEQLLPIDIGKRLSIAGDHCLRQILQGIQDHITLTQAAHRQFANNERVGQHAPTVQQAGKLCAVAAQMIDPYRTVDQDHAGSARRRGAAVAFGSVPPSKASRRALSRSISALSASRTSEDFSVRPVKAWALATRSSSRAIVVRMATSRD